MAKKLWGGRFRKELEKSAEEYLQSIEVDKEMVLEDVWGSEAHAVMLCKQGIIADRDLKEILYWLEKVKRDFQKGKFKLSKEAEDVHMNVEGVLIREAGKEYGGKLHTARSRNDQVITDARLYIRRQILDIEELVIQLQKTFLDIGRKHLETPMPGYTHTQDAQPITLAYWATAYVSLLMRDLSRLENAYGIVDTNPLGSCALAGTSFPIDRRLTTKLLGFSGLHKHSLDAISSRDFIAETLCALAINMSNLSKLAEEMVYWSTFEFNLITLDDRYTAGSSIMPQKKNPCVAELTRGRTGAVYGSLMQLLTTLKAIPMGYNRDLQEDKPPLWNAIKTVKSTLYVVNGMIGTIKFHEERMEELAGANFTTATEIANYLVIEKKVPFRKSHEIVGNLVATLVEEGKSFKDFDTVDRVLKMSGIGISFNDLRDIIDSKKAVQAYKSEGSTSPKEVAAMIGEFEESIRRHEKGIKQRRERIEGAKRLTESVVKSVLSGKKIKSIDM
ncbi:MAG: argininosuccinate lyase [Candidatus Altiarchaeota archaeon]|nr:argininosuccinate lyase [Candidatus Altiarchaeota archaeon]